MLSRRDPSAPRLALFLLALFLGFGSATAPAWSLDLDNLVREAPGILISRLSALFWLGAEDATATPTVPPATGTPPPSGGSGGPNEAGIVIDPNGAPRT